MKRKYPFFIYSFLRLVCLYMEGEMWFPLPRKCMSFLWGRSNSYFLEKKHLIKKGAIHGESRLHPTTKRYHVKYEEALPFSFHVKRAHPNVVFEHRKRFFVALCGLDYNREKDEKIIKSRSTYF